MVINLRKPSLITLLTTTFLLFSPIYAGTLKPYGVNNIDASVANRAQRADYTFSFTPDTTIPEGGLVKVIFPTQYDSDLGVSSSTGCSVSCSISNFAVYFTIPIEIMSGTAMSVTIYQVMNPSIKGGTGSFQIQTLQGVNVLDENLIFGVIGIADSVGTLTSTIVSVASTGLANAGETTRYNFQFKVSQLIPAQSYMKLTIQDQNFGLTTFPACNAFAINGKTIQGKFSCETSGQNILVRGLGADIPASQDVGISVAMINPKFSGTTDSFTIALLREGTNVIYDVKSGIAGVTISAGQISSISLVQVDTAALQSRNKLMDYILTFQLKNGLTSNSVITLVFPPSFVIDTTASAIRYIRYGLEDIAEDNTVGLSVDPITNILSLTNFQAFDVPQEISLFLRLNNPDNVGETTPINIISYLDPLQTVVVDSDTVSAYTVIANIPGPTYHAITDTTVTAGDVQSAIEFNLQPSVTIPQAGVLQIRVPEGFTLGTITSTTCQITDATGTYVNAASCTSSGNKITLVFPTTVSFPLGFVRKFRLRNNLITAPTTNSTYLFDVTSYLTDGTTVIESWTDYLIVAPAPFISPTYTTLERFQGRQTILNFGMQTKVKIPAGINQYKSTDTKGFLEFEFKNTATDLGLGFTTVASIPCYANSGLVPISGSVNCTLIPGTPALIRVDNFQEIPAQTLISISFPRLVNPSVNYNVKMKTIKLSNRVRTELNSITVPFTIPATATMLSDPVTSSTSIYAFTSTDVSTTTTITFNPQITGTLALPGTFVIQLPKYDIGWIPVPSSDAITCKMDNTVYACTRYYGADWITIRAPTGISKPTQISISGLQIPRYSNQNVGGIVLQYIPSTNMRTVLKNMLPFTPATVPTFTQATLIADKKNKGAVNAQYTLVFVAPNDIPTGASIIITLPTGYNLLSSSPPVSFSSPDLIPLADKLSYSASIESVTISGFATQSAYTSFSIVISGLKNPNTLSISQTWTAQVTYDGNLMLYHTDFDKFVFTGALSAGSITYNSIVAFPMNADEEATYTINFVPSSIIPAGGKISITFPTGNYESLPSPPSCRISGGITTFSSCSLSGNTYTIVLDTQYSSGGIIVSIDEIKNPDRGTTNGFIVQTFYDGVMLDDTDTSSIDSRTVTITDEGETLVVQSISFDPKNEGENANYTFSFVPSNTIESTMEIQIVFPIEYDKTLGSTIDCDAPSGLLGTIKCSVKDRVVTVTGFDTYLPDVESPVTISIFGVTNPNQGASETGQFKIGTLNSGSTSYVDYNSEVGAFTIAPAPGWSTLYAVTPQNLYTRLESNYFFNFTASTTIPKTSSEGAVLIDYPSEFSIDDGETACDATTEDFAEIITCTFSRNTLSIQGQTQDYAGNVGVILRNILNPIEKGTAQNIVVKTYDGLNSLIIERSFKNLDPFIFTYTYPGPLITVNNDQPIYAFRGTRTNTTLITLDYPCALNLTLKSTNPGFSILPFAITLSLGQVEAEFELSIPESFPEGTYEIEWETQGDLLPPYYTPIKNTQVIISTASTMIIQAPTINSIPFGGNSLPASFTVDYGPDIDLEITVNFLVTYAGLSLSTNLVTLAAGQTKASFMIYSSSDATTRVSKGSLVLSLAGTNVERYALSTTSVAFSVTDPDLTPPEVTSLTVTDITQNRAIVNISTSEICMVYYMMALAGTVLPELSEVKTQGPAPYSTTQSQYGVIQIMSGQTDISIPFKNLVAETPYVIYVYLVDAGDNVNTPAAKTFTTLNRDNGVTFSLKFNLFDLNQAEKDQIVQSISFILSLWLNKLQEQKYVIDLGDEDDRLLAQYEPANPYYKSANFLGQSEYGNSSARLLQEDVFILMNLQLAATPESAVYPSPKDLALSLNNKGTQIEARMNDADVTYRIEAFEFQRYQPAFPAAPIIIDVTSDSATFSGKLSNYGYIFVACVRVEDDHGVPTPYQILRGFDNRNIAVPSASVEISEPYETFQIYVEDLLSMTNYTAYIIGGSAHPGYPDPMDAKTITQIKFTTYPANYIGALDIKGESRMSVGFSGFFGLVVMFWVGLLMI